MLWTVLYNLSKLLLVLLKTSLVARTKLSCSFRDLNFASMLLMLQLNCASIVVRNVVYAKWTELQ